MRDFDDKQDKLCSDCDCNWESQRSKVPHCLLGIVEQDVTNRGSCRVEDFGGNVAIKGRLRD